MYKQNGWTQKEKAKKQNIISSRRRYEERKQTIVLLSTRYNYSWITLLEKFDDFNKSLRKLSGFFVSNWDSVNSMKISSQTSTVNLWILFLMQLLVSVIYEFDWLITIIFYLIAFIFWISMVSKYWLRVETG